MEIKKSIFRSSDRSLLNGQKPPRNSCKSVQGLKGSLRAGISNNFNRLRHKLMNRDVKVQ